MEIEYEYDQVVIGGGSGGLACAQRAAGQGKKVALCDFVKPSTQGTKWGLGGTCVNVGCIPKKLMHFSSLVGDIREDAQECGWDVDPEKKHDWKRMLKNISAHIKGINFAYRKTMIKKEIKYCNALASFVDAHTIKLVDAKNKESTITGQIQGKTRFKNK